MKRRSSHFSGEHRRSALTAVLPNNPLLRGRDNRDTHGTIKPGPVDSPKVRRIHHQSSFISQISSWTMIPTRNPAVFSTRSDSFSKVESSRRSKMKRAPWWRPSQLAPRLFFAMFLGRFSWDLYMIHNVSWPQDVLQPSGLDVHRRFLEQFRKSQDDDSSGQLLREPSSNIRLRHPPPFSLSRSFTDDDIGLLSIDSLSGLGSPTTLRDSVDSERSFSWLSISGQYEWKNRCRAAGLDETSKVFISDIIRQPAASLTALFLVKQCNVKQILGSDPLFPNIRAARLRYMQVYRTLLQKIPNFRLVLTDHGLRSSADSRGPKWLFDFDPSHIIIAQHTSLEQDIDYVMKRQSYQLFQEKHHYAVWRDLWLTLEKRRNDMKEPRIIHLESTSFSPFDGPHTIADTYFPLLTAHQFTRNFVQVKLPQLYGPGYGLLTSADDPFQDFETLATANVTQSVYVEDALAAILAAMYSERPARRIDLSELLESHVQKESFEIELSLRIRRTQAWQKYLQFPFGLGQGRQAIHNRNSTDLNQSSILTNHGAVIPNPTKMPCASQCTSEYYQCEPSSFDDVLERSRQHTKNCQYVIYFGNFSDKIQLPSAKEDPSVKGLCRLAFVSSSNELVHSLWRKSAEYSNAPLSSANGKLVHNRWRLFWPSRKYTDFTIGDASLLRIDPSRLFSPTVRKALFLSSSFDAYMKISDQQAMGMFANANAPSYKSNARAFKQHRGGTHLSRWVHMPAAKARHSVLMGGSFFSKDIGDVTPATFVRNQPHSKKQLAFYQQMSHWVHTNQGRPQFEIDSTIYKTFPYEWIAPFFLVHDFQMEDSRQLRCKWFEEHLSWGSEQAKGRFEEISLAFLIGKQKSLGLMGLEDNALMQQDGWLPYLDQQGEFLTDESGGEVFIHLVRRKEK